MPQVQIVDSTENKPEPTGVEEFFSKLGKSYQDQSDRAEIGKLIDEYKANREDANAWENLQLGLEESNISPTKRLETQATLNNTKKLIIDQDKALNSKANKMKEKAVSIEQGLDTLKRQREILATGHLGPKLGGIGSTGRKAGSTFSKEGNALRAEYERLGKSLISMSSNIPIRNRQEFEVLAHDLYDPTKSQEEIKGILDAMERILQGQLPQEEKGSEPISSKATTERPPLSSFMR